MSRFIPKLGMGRICLISSVLLCSVFMSKNAFSRREWSNRDIVVTYDQNDNAINFTFLVYNYCITSQVLGYLKWCEFLYCEEGDKEYISLMRTNIRAQKVIDCVSISMKYKKYNADIIVYSRYRPNGIKLPFGELGIEQKLRYVNLKVNRKVERSYIADIRAKWYLPKPSMPIKSILVIGLWSSDDISFTENIYEIYPVNTVKSNSNTLKNATSELNSEISNKVKVFGGTDAIIVTGAEPGEDIKVYTGSGAEVKSFVANDDVVNIKLPTNQIYIVKTGQARYKVAL